MALVVALGAFVTLLALALLGVGGYLAALLAVPRYGGSEPERWRGRSGPEPLLLAVASLLLALAQGVVLALILGALGALHLGLALALQTGLVWVLHRNVRRRLASEGGPGIFGPGEEIFRALWRKVRGYPALSLIAVHAVGAELVRGVLRPPLSWDSLMYHLYLTASWLQQGDLGLMGARGPTTAYLFAPANGSLWTWWWMAPSHSELWVNLAHLPSWLLLGLATGAFARELGARRHWPVAAFLTVLTPAVLRFVGTQYVDIMTAACLISASVFAARWLRRPDRRDALLAGVGMGLAAGTKVVGLAFAGVLAPLAFALALSLRPSSWGRRASQMTLALLVALALGGFFYVRNLAWGGGLFGHPCVQQGPDTEGVLDNFPAPTSVAALWDEVTGEDLLLDTFLGSTRPTMADLGVGPQAALLFVTFLLLPFGVSPERRRVAWLAVGQVAAQLVFWVLVPHAANAHVLANVRYLDGALALLFAGSVALAERFLADLWVRGLAIAVLVQDLLMVRTALPRESRIFLAAALAVALALALAPRLRRGLVARWRLLAVGGCLAAIALAPVLAGHRIRDRERAFEEEYTAHLTSTRMFAEGWGWLDRNAGGGVVAVSHAPENYFVYPAMGPFLERRAIYVPVNEAAHENPLRYDGCDVRATPSREAWLRNLRREGVRWLYVARFPEFEFPLEDRWARQRPDLFALRFDHRLNRVYELIGGSQALRADDPKKLRTASQTASTSRSWSSGNIGSDRARSAERSATGSSSPSGAKRVSAGWRCRGTG